MMKKQNLKGRKKKKKEKRKERKEEKSQVRLLKHTYSHTASFPIGSMPKRRGDWSLFESKVDQPAV